VVFVGAQPIFDPQGYFIDVVGVSRGALAQDIDVRSVRTEQAVESTTTM